MNKWTALAVCAVAAAAVGIFAIWAFGVRSDDSGGGDAVSISETVSTTDVIEQFREQTGDLLIRSSGSDSYWDILDFGDRPSSLDDKYGLFEIRVVKSAGIPLAWRVSPYFGTPIEPDLDGIYWDMSERDEVWAVRQYGKNIFLRWYAEEEGVTDTTWDRLNSVLTDIAEPVTDGFFSDLAEPTP